MATKIQQLKEIVGRFFARQKLQGCRLKTLTLKRLK